MDAEIQTDEFVEIQPGEFVKIQPDEVAEIQTDEVARRGTKRKFHHLDRAVVMTEPSGAKMTYPYHSLPEPVREHLYFVGLSTLLMRADDPNTTYDKLDAGDIKVRAAPAPAEVDPWREAIALALAGAAKNRGQKLPLAEARFRVASMDDDEVDNYKSSAEVIVHHNKLTGQNTDALSELLAA